MLLLAACAEPKPAPPGEDAGWQHEILVVEGIAALTWGDGAGWAVGGDGLVVRIADGWTEVGAPGTLGVGGAAGALWALTTGGIAAWAEGGPEGGWTEIPFEVQPGNPRDLMVRADGTVAVLADEDLCDETCAPSHVSRLSEWDGGAWTLTTPTPRPEGLVALAELDDGTLVAVGDDGLVARWDGADWVEIGRASGADLFDVAAEGTGFVAVGEAGAVVRGTASGLDPVESAGSEDLLAVAGWALGATAAWVDRGAGWEALPLPEGDWRAIAATDDGRVLVGGGDADGVVGLEGDADGLAEAWRRQRVPLINEVWVDAAGVAWLACEDGVIATWDGERLRSEAVDPGGGFVGIDGVGSARDVVVAYDSGVVTWDGAAWTVVELEGVDELQLSDVAVAPDGAAFASGFTRDEAETSTPAFLRRDGGVWAAEVPPDAGRALIALHAFAADEVYGVSWPAPAQLVAWDGRAWTVLVADLGRAYESLWGRSGTDLYLGADGEGEGPALLRWDGAGVTEVVGAPPRVRGIAGDETRLIAGGWDGDARVVTEYAAGAWVEQLRPESGPDVAIGGGVDVVTAWREAWRR